MTRDEQVPIIELAEAKGADRMLLSTNGRWLALAFHLAADLPLVVRLDRQGEIPPQVARGILAGPPRNDGTMFYVEQESPDRRGVLASAGSSRHSHLRRLGTPERLSSFNGAYSARLIDEHRLVVIGSLEEQYEVMIVDAGSGRTLIHREPIEPLGFMWSFITSEGRIHLLFDPSETAGEPIRTDGHIVITLALDDLRELWRRDQIAPTSLYTRPQLGLDDAGQRLLVISAIGDDVVTFDAATGEPGPMLRLPHGGPMIHFVPTSRPTEDALIFWTKRGRHGSSRRGWKLLRLHGDEAAFVADRPHELPPGAGVWDGSRLLIAPFGNPRLRDQADQWGEEVLRYLRLLDE